MVNSTVSIKVFLSVGEGRVLTEKNIEVPCIQTHSTVSIKIFFAEVFDIKFTKSHVS